MNFKVGDWIIYKEEFIEEHLKHPMFSDYSIKDIKRQIWLPVKIIKIEEPEPSWLMVQGIYGKISRELPSEYRYATKSEIEKQKLKTVFKKGKYNYEF